MFFIIQNINFAKPHLRFRPFRVRINALFIGHTCFTSYGGIVSVLRFNVKTLGITDCGPCGGLRIGTDSRGGLRIGTD